MTRLPVWLQIAESEWDSIKASVLAICASSSRSSKPAIYGVAAEAEIRRLRPLSSMGQLEVRTPLLCHPRRAACKTVLFAAVWPRRF